MRSKMDRWCLPSAIFSLILLFCPTWVLATPTNTVDSAESGAAALRQLLSSGSDACRLQFGRQCKYCIRRGPNPRCTGVATPQLFTVRSGRPVPKPGVEPRPVKFDPIGARTCRAGYIKSAAGNYKCFKCTANTYSPVLGGTSCRKCVAPRRVNFAHTTCTAQSTRRPTRRPTRSPTPAPAPTCIPEKGPKPFNATDDIYLIASSGRTDLSILNAESYRTDGGAGWKRFPGPLTPTTDYYEENILSKLVTMPNGQLLVVGGGTMDYAKTGLFFDVPSQSYCKTGPHVVPGRTFHQAVVLPVWPDGRALSIGGRYSPFGGPSPAPTAAVESFTFEGGWVAEAPMATPREMHSAVLLKNGNVLVCGGQTRTAVLATCEVFVTSTSTWQPTGSMAIPRSNFPMVLLPTPGKVFAATGREGELASAKAEVYTPSTGTWVPVATAPTARLTAQAVVDRSGYDIVLLIGGAIPPTTETSPDPIVWPESLASVDAYDVETETWLPKNTYGPLALARHDHTAVTLPYSKDILVVGGFYLPTYCECVTFQQIECRRYDPVTKQSIEVPQCETNVVERLPFGATQWQLAPPLQLGRSSFATAFLSVPKGMAIGVTS